MSTRALGLGTGKCQMYSRQKVIYWVECFAASWVFRTAASPPIVLYEVFHHLYYSQVRPHLSDPLINTAHTLYRNTDQPLGRSFGQIQEPFIGHSIACIHPGLWLSVCQIPSMCIILTIWPQLSMCLSDILKVDFFALSKLKFWSFSHKKVQISH